MGLGLHPLSAWRHPLDHRTRREKPSRAQRLEFEVPEIYEAKSCRGGRSCIERKLQKPAQSLFF